MSYLNMCGQLLAHQMTDDANNNSRSGIYPFSIKGTASILTLPQITPPFSHPLCCHIDNLAV